MKSMKSTPISTKPSTLYFLQQLYSVLSNTNSLIGLMKSGFLSSRFHMGSRAISVRNSPRRPAPCVANAASIEQGGIIPLTLLEPKSRKYKSLLPPTDERETKAFQYVPGLFAFDQPLGVGIFQAGLRMTVVDLGNGDLWVHAPVGRTEELIALFDQVLTPGKRVAHIVIPNTSPEHSYYSAEWAAAFPDAQVWMPPGFDKFPAKAPEVDRMVKAGRCRVMSEEPPAEWNGAIEVACFKAGDTVFCECVFFVKAARALLTSDSCFFAKDDWVPNPISKFLAQASGIYQQLGAPALKPVFSTFKPEAQAWVARVLSFDFDMIVPAHVSGPVYDGKRQFKQAFSFVGDLRAV